MSGQDVQVKQEDRMGCPEGNSGQPRFLAVGKLRRPHGVRGEMVMEVFTDFPERLTPGTKLYLGSEHKSLRLKRCRNQDKFMLVSFEGYNAPEQVGLFRNQVVFVLAEDRPPLPEGEYYHHELIGLRAITEDGGQLGQVTEILETGANDVLVIMPESGPEILLPLIDAVILNVDIHKGQLTVRLIPGILDEGSGLG